MGFRRAAETVHDSSRADGRHQRWSSSSDDQGRQQPRCRKVFTSRVDTSGSFAAGVGGDAFSAGRPPDDSRRNDDLS